MPYQWTPRPAPETDNWQLELWPYRSLLRRDFVVFIAGTATLVALPLIALAGSPALWVILGFFALMIWGLWGALHISYRRGDTLEQCVATSKHIVLTHQTPNGEVQKWEANRYWVTVHMHPKGGPVENYLTLRGGDREVEIGAFLDVSERRALYDELRMALRNA